MKNITAIYCRLSEEDRNKKDRKDDSGSIQNQKLMLTEYAQKQGWEIYKIYSDDDYTGSDRNRPAFNEMITDARAGRFNIVLCKTQSRFTRELEIVETYIHNLFPKLGIRFVSIVDNIDTDIAGNKKTRQINGLINEWYLEDMSDSIKAALRTRMKAGYFIGSFAPYGYKKDPEEKGHLIIDEEAAEVVREIYRLYISGTGRSKIARILNERGIPSPDEYYRVNKIKSRSIGKKNVSYWKYYTVSHILENEVYIGNLIQGKTHNPTYKSKHSVPSEKEDWVRIENTHEPVIDRETWELTRRLWSARSRPCYMTDLRNKYSGILVCSKCGYGMTVAYNKHKRYFRCNSAKYGKNCCEGTSIFESTLDKAVLKEISAIKDRYLNSEAVAKNSLLNDAYTKRIEQLEKQKRFLEKKMNESENALKNLYIDKLKGVVSENQFTDLSRVFAEEKENYIVKIRVLDKDIEEETVNNADIHNKTESIKKLISFDDVTRELITLFIKRIGIGGNKNNRVIDIYWKF